MKDDDLQESSQKGNGRSEDHRVVLPVSVILFFSLVVLPFSLLALSSLVDLSIHSVPVTFFNFLPACRLTYLTV